MVHFDKLPIHMQDLARRYIEKGIPPGDFMYAVLRNQLVEAFSAADEINTAAMRDWAAWLYNDCPSAAWRTEENIRAWIESGGLYGAGRIQRGKEE